MEQERLNTLDVAINNELQERTFYLTHAARTANLMGKAMFEQLAVEELEHCSLLKEIHLKWSENGVWPETVPLHIEGTSVRALLAGLIAGITETSPADADDLEAIRIALDFEWKSERFYADLRDAVSAPVEKTFFNLLSSIEHEHYLSLLDTFNYLTKP